MKNRYQIRIREIGEPLDEYDTFNEARSALEEYEREDEAEGNYIRDFYEIYDTEEERIVW